MATKAAVKFLPFHVPSIDDSEINGVIEVLRTGWITTGPKVVEFEDAFAGFLGTRHAIAVSSCTAALHLALEAIGLNKDDEVLLPAMTFTATAEVVTYFGAKPVLVDCEPRCFTIDPTALESKLTCRSRAIIPVHFAGHPCRMTDIHSIAKTKALSVIDDAAHAFPAKFEGRYVGTLSSLTAFSFYATKPLTTGEGGMVTTDNDALASRIRTMRLHGMDAGAWKRYSAAGSWRYDVAEAGYKYNLTDVQAALGLAQLAKADTMWQRRAQIARKYGSALRNIDVFETPHSESAVEHAWHLYVILICPEGLRIGRDEIIEELKRRGIGAAVHFIPLNLHSYYQKRWGYRSGQFPVAEDYFQRCISLPLYPTMRDEDVDRVVDALDDIALKFRR